MEIKFIVDMNFSPDEQTTIMAFVAMPAMMAGVGQEETFTSYDLGYEKLGRKNRRIIYRT